MTIPTLSIREVASAIGAAFPIAVIDVGSQTDLQGWTLGDWADYWEVESSDDVAQKDLVV